MAIQVQGAGGSVADVGAFAAKGMHTVAKPHDVGALGAYQFAGVTGAIAAGAAANSEVFHFRWTDATRLCLVTSVRVTGMRATTAFAVGVIDIKATVARSWTVDGSGGTTLTLTGDNQNLRTSFAAPLMGSAGAMRISTTAALTAGTKTLDAQDIGFIATHSSGGVGSATPIIGSIYLPTTELLKYDVNSGEYLLVIAANEGLVVRATVPATGVWNLGIEIKWMEVTAF